MENWLQEREVQIYSEKSCLPEKVLFHGSSFLGQPHTDFSHKLFPNTIVVYFVVQTAI